jgi:hypothetical protein
MPFKRITRRTVGSNVSNAVLVAGKIQITGASGVPLQTSKQGKLFTLVQTGTGLYTITIDGNGNTFLLHATVGTVDATGGYVANVRTVDAATRTITFQTGTAADPLTPANPPANTWLTFSAVCNANSKNN